MYERVNTEKSKLSVKLSMHALIPLSSKKVMQVHRIFSRSHSLSIKNNLNENFDNHLELSISYPFKQMNKSKYWQNLVSLCELLCVCKFGVVSACFGLFNPKLATIMQWMVRHMKSVGKSFPWDDSFVTLLLVECTHGAACFPSFLTFT